jgi:ankyrin repeat protein
MRAFGLAAVLLAGGACFAASDLRLIEAIKSQNPKAVDALLSSQADVNAAQPDGATPLAWAVYLNQTEVAERLLKAGAKVNTADEYGDSPLTLACGLGNDVLVDKLLTAGADANSARWNGETALMIASRSGSVKAVKLLLDHGAKPDAVDANKNQNALMWAAAEGHSNVVELLLKSGANPKLASKAGFNPMVFAIQKNDAKSVKLLLAAGLDANYALPNKTTVLQVAVMGGKTEVAAALIDAGANVNIADAGGNTPLHIAAQAGNLQLVNSLLAKKADVNVKTSNAENSGRQGGGGGQFRPAGGQTPLLLAAKANKEAVMRALVAAGADPKLKAQDGTTLLMSAVGSGHIEAVKYAYELDPNVNATTDRKTAMMHAAVSGTLGPATQKQICEVIQFLADKGADLDPLDGRGRTPITIANVLPIDNAVDLLAQLIEKSGKTPKQSPKR